MTDQGHPRFPDRPPEATAHQLASALAWHAEEHLKTFEILRGRRGTAVNDLRRHQDLVAMVVAQCVELGVSPHGTGGERYARLETAIQAYHEGRPVLLP